MNPICLLLPLPILTPPLTQTPTDPFLRYELPNGMRVIQLWIEDAPRQTSMTLFPAGLLSDAPGRAQYAHLLEHMLIYNVESERLEQPGLTFNGETTGPMLRLDTYAEPEAWQESIALQTLWLAGRLGPFSAEILQRELERIRGEEETTVGAGYVGKWAQAAFSQIVLGKLEHAKVHGDVAESAVEGIAEYARQRLRIGAEVCFVSLGPAEPAALRAVIERELGSLERTPPASSQAAPPEVYTFGQKTATWDLAASAYLEWYALPGSSARERAAALILGTRLNQLLYASSDPSLQSCRIQVDPMFSTPAGPGILIALGLTKPLTAAELSEQLQSSIAAICSNSGGLPALEFSIQSLSLELSGLPPWELLRKQVRGSPAEAYVEANVVLAALQVELSTGFRLPELATATSSLSAAELQEFQQTIFAPAKRNSLLLLKP